MKIETKFDIGQIVYFVIVNNIEVGKINGINICDEKIEYVIDNGYYTMAEQSLLVTLDEAINKIRNNLTIEMENKISQKKEEAEEKIKELKGV